MPKKQLYNMKGCQKIRMNGGCNNGTCALGAKPLIGGYIYSGTPSARSLSRYSSARSGSYKKSRRGKKSNKSRTKRRSTRKTSTYPTASTAYSGGASAMPTDLTNLGRQFMFGVGSVYNGVMGQHAPVNPMPYKDQLVRGNK